MNELKQNIKIGTLGPKGTSSEAAVTHFIQIFKKIRKLFNGFIK